MLAWWPRWRAADERGREHLRTLLSPSAVETLLRLEENVHAARVARSRGEVLAALLFGLVVPEPARVVSDLARAVYPEAGDWERDGPRYSALEAALREHLKAPREKSQPPAAAPVGKPTLPQEPAYSWRGNSMTVNADKISREKLTGMVAANGLPHHQDEEPEAVEPEASTPTAAEPWPWSTQDLTPRQEEVFEALRKRNLRPDCIVPAAAQREIAREMKTTPGNVGFHLSEMRKRLQITEFSDPEPAAPRPAPDTSPSASLPNLSGNGNHLTRGDAPAAAPPLPPLQSGQAMVQAEVLELELRAQVANLTEELRQAHIIGTEQALEIVELQTHGAAQLRTIEAQARLNDRVRDENATLQDEVKRLTATGVDCPAPAEEPLTQEQRGAALLLAAGVSLDSPMDSTVSVWRRALALAADLAALAERR